MTKGGNIQSATFFYLQVIRISLILFVVLAVAFFLYFQQVLADR